MRDGLLMQHLRRVFAELWRRASSMRVPFVGTTLTDEGFPES